MKKAKLKCPKCRDEFYEKISSDEKPFYAGHNLCLNCMTVFSDKGKLIERG